MYLNGVAIVTEIRRLDWLGHDIRMKDIRIPNMIRNTKPEGIRGVGGPKLSHKNSRYKNMETEEIVKNG
jgi:hypothetical protein